MTLRLSNRFCTYLLVDEKGSYPTSLSGEVSSAAFLTGLLVEALVMTNTRAELLSLEPVVVVVVLLRSTEAEVSSEIGFIILRVHFKDCGHRKTGKTESHKIEIMT